VADGVTGVLVPAGDPGALAAAVTALLADPHRAACLGEGAYRQARARFDARAHASQVHDVYAEILG
jgi:glycosyltransferase involved in cell wall biosynthesis